MIICCPLPVTTEAAMSRDLPRLNAFQGLPKAVPPRPGERLPWRQVARQLALGKTTDEVAEEFAVPALRIRRNLRRSLRFRDYIKEETDDVAEEAKRRAAALPFRYSEALVDALGKGDPRLLLWIGERLGIPRGKKGVTSMTAEEAAEARVSLAAKIAAASKEYEREEAEARAAEATTALSWEMGKF
jgi:hypothetical protein